MPSQRHTSFSYTLGETTATAHCHRLSWVHVTSGTGFFERVLWSSTAAMQTIHVSRIRKQATLEKGDKKCKRLGGCSI